MTKLHLILLLTLLIITDALGICLPPNHCLEDMEEDMAKERFDYVLAKYDELKMKIPGQPVSLRGKIVTHGEVEEQHISFQYVDNTPHDVIQTCVFVITNVPGECESIVTVCNTFLSRTPRPLLERKPLTVCEDGVKEAETEAPAPDVMEETEVLQAQKQQSDLADDSELI